MGPLLAGMARRQDSNSSSTARGRRSSMPARTRRCPGRSRPLQVSLGDRVSSWLCHGQLHCLAAAPIRRVHMLLMGVAQMNPCRRCLVLAPHFFRICLC